jgi:hypothetical protein
LNHVDLDSYLSFDFPAMTIEQLEGLARPVRGSQWALPLERVSALLAPGYRPMENGLARLPDGTLEIAVRIDMPGCTAAMWDWWFGWHSYEDKRYVIWHPLAHEKAAMVRDQEDATTDKAKYIGNCSIITENVGAARLENSAVNFVDPSELGFDTSELAKAGTAICAYLGYQPWDDSMGHFVHFFRDRSGGCEQRSRFYLKDAPEALGRELIPHCVEEYGHLASFLPRLYAEVTGRPI